MQKKNSPETRIKATRNTSPQKRTALVTGANGNIGRAICKVLTASGFSVVGVDAISGKDEPWPVIKADLRKVKTLDALIAKVERSHGPIEVLVNNAAVSSLKTDFFDITLDDFTRAQEVNLRAPFFLCRAVAKRLIARKRRGVLVNISSNAGKVPNLTTEYACSKAGVDALTRSLARHLGPHGIRVVAVAPGTIAKGLASHLKGAVLKKRESETFVGRLGTGDEIAAMVGFVCSDAASFVNGVTLDVNGGRV